MEKSPKTSQYQGAKKVQNNRKKHLPLLATSHALNHAYQLLTPVLAPALIIEYGNAFAGLFVSCFLLSYSLLPVVSGYLTQRFGRRLLSIGFAATASCFVAIGFTNNVIILGFLFFIAGAAGSTYHPSGFPILAETYQTTRGQALGLHQTGGAIGSLLGPILTGLMLVSFSWRPTIMIMAIPGFVLSAVLWFSIENQPKPKDTISQRKISANMKDLKVPHIVFLLIAAAFFYMIGQRGTDAFASVYFADGRGIKLLEASLLYAALKVGGLFSSPICGRLSDTYGRKNVLIPLVIIGSVSLYAITAVPVTLIVFPCIAFSFAAFGLLTVGESLLADITPENKRAAIFGLNVTFNFSPYIFLTPILFSISGLYGFNLGFVILSLLMLVSIPLILKIRNKSSTPLGTIST